MSIMQAEVYDAFIAAKVPEEKARAAAEVIAQKPQNNEVATKLDLAELKNKLILWIAACTGIIITAIGIATTVIIAFIN